jgi:signal peptidase I
VAQPARAAQPRQDLNPDRARDTQLTANAGSLQREATGSIHRRAKRSLSSDQQAGLGTILATRVGQIVVFHPPAGADPVTPRCGNAGQGAGTETPCSRPTSTASSQTFIKRVVGVAGDRIAIRGGHVVRNGRLQSEPFARRCSPGADCDFLHAITVPDGHVYVMGDNRGHSEDSRFWGPVPIAWVIGKAVMIYWPPGEAGSP